MTEQILLKIVEVLLIIATFLIGATSEHISTEEMEDLSALMEDGVGTASFNQVAGGIYRLKSGITSSQTTLPLSGFTMPVTDNEFSMTDFGDIGYGTIEPTSPNNKEFVSFTGITQNSDGSATLTGVERGLNFISDFTASTTLQLPHSGGSRFILSNSPVFYTQFHNLNNNATSTANLSFGSTTPPRFDWNPNFGSHASTTLISKGYADDLAIAGASDSNETTKGIVEQATGTEMASSTTAGDTTAPLALTTKYSTSTPDVSATRPNHYAVISEHSGYLNKDWFGLGINVATTTPWQNAHIAIEQNDSLYQILVGDNGTTTPLFFIDGKGNVGIGTTTPMNPNFALAVVGTTSMDGFFMQGGTVGQVLTSNSNGSGTWKDSPVAFTVSSSTSHSVSATGTLFGIFIPEGIIDSDSSIELSIHGDSAGSATWQGLVIEIGTAASSSEAVFGDFSQCSFYSAVINISARDSTSSQIISGFGNLSTGGACGQFREYPFKTRDVDLSSGDVLIRVRGGTVSGQAITTEQVTLKIIP